MEALQAILDWFWGLQTDGLIIEFAKQNVIIITVIGVLIRYWAKKTPSPEDDMLLDDLKQALSIVKRK
jgi:hypothetical protein